MFIVEPHSADERALSKKVFESFMSMSTEEYDNWIEEYSKKLGLKSSKELRKYRDTYYQDYASKDQQSAFIVKRHEVNSNLPKYAEFCDKLFELPVDRRYDFIIANKLTPCTLKKLFESYKNNNGKYSSYVDGFLDEYKKYYNSNLDNKRENEKSIKLKEACSFFEDMINNGYYSVYDYAYCNGLNYESVSRKVTAYKARLRKYDKDLLDNYCASLEANRKKRFFCYKNEIDNFCLDLANSKADIVDYYIRFDMPITHFKSLCKDNVAPNQQICLNVLFDKVKDVVDVPYNENMLLECNYSINGIGLSDEEKRILIGFMRENKIPFSLYQHVFSKYIKGDLDTHINLKTLNKIL